MFVAECRAAPNGAMFSEECTRSCSSAQVSGVMLPSIRVSMHRSMSWPNLMHPDLVIDGGKSRSDEGGREGMREGARESRVEHGI